MSNGNYKLTNLMPYGENTRLCDYRQNIKIIKVAIKLLTITADAIQDFLSQDLAKLDPHVGDNLCQIRACMLLDFFKLKQAGEFSQPNYQALLTDIKKKIIFAESIFTYHQHNLILWQKKQYKNPFYNMSIEQFLEKTGLNIRLPEKIFCLSLCAFLSHYRTLDTEQNFVINYARLKLDFETSKDFCRRIVHHCQKTLSILSSQYIKQLAQHSQWPITAECINENLCQDDDGRYVLPCFLIMPLLLERLLQLNIPVTLITKNPFISEDKCEHLNYQAGSKDHNLYHLTPTTPNSTGFIIHCISYYHGKTFTEFKREIKRYSLHDLLLACMASHPQFSGKRLTHLKNNPFKNQTKKLANTLEKQLFAYKNLSHYLGCHKEKPMTLFIQHIFADNISQQVSFANGNKFYADQMASLTVASFHGKTKHSNLETCPQFEVA